MSDFMHRVERSARPGAFLVDIFPWMLHLPEWMAKWKRAGQQWFEGNTAFFNGLVREVEENMVRLSCREDPDLLAPR